MNFPKYSFTTDQDGNEILLKDGTYQVMMAWEKPYMEACIEELQPQGDVLEIGFGLGYSANAIQQFPIQSHTIIEYHPTVIAQAQAWAQSKKGVTLVEDTWQNSLKTLGQFDSIFFDDYPLETKEQVSKLAEYEKKSRRTVDISSSQNGVTKEDFLAFFEHLQHGEMPLIEPQFLYTFLRDLEKQRILTKKDTEWALSQAQEIGLLSEETYAETPQESPRSPDRLHTFLKTCLDNHMKRGARFSCYLETSHSRFEDPFFYNEIILNPYLTYSEKKMNVTPPKHCAYFTGTEALLITIQKW